MTNRPEILFPLHKSLTSLDGIGPGIERKMRGLSIEKPLDLLLTLPISGIKRELWIQFLCTPQADMLWLK